LLKRSHLQRVARLTLPPQRFRRRTDQERSNRSYRRDPGASAKLPCLAPGSADARCIDRAQIRAPPGKSDSGRPRAGARDIMRTVAGHRKITAVVSSILRQDIDFTKLLLKLLNTLDAIRVVGSVAVCRHGAPALPTRYDRNSD
jgi:hypothetical protein